MPNKKKIPQPETPSIPQGRDQFLTPNYAVKLVLKYVPTNWRVWEPCAGLKSKMVDCIGDQGYCVRGTTIETGYDALTYDPDFAWDVAITNPPYSIKIKVVKRFLDLNKPFALLIPADWTAWLIEAIDDRGCKLIIPKRRINYITPTGKSGKESSSMFHSAWLTWGLPGLKKEVTFVRLGLEQYKDV